MYLAKALRMSGGDHLHSGTVVGKLEGEREVTLGFVDLMRDPIVEKDRDTWSLLHSELGFSSWSNASSIWWYSRMAHASSCRDFR